MAGPNGNSRGPARKDSLDHSARDFRDILRRRYFGQRETELRDETERIRIKTQMETTRPADGGSATSSKEVRLLEGSSTESISGSDRAAAAGQPPVAISSGVGSSQPKADGAEIVAVKPEKVADRDSELKSLAEDYGVIGLLELAVNHDRKHDFAQMLASFKSLQEVFEIPMVDQAVRRELLEDLEVEALPKAIRCATMRFYALITALRKQQASVPAVDVNRYAKCIAERLSALLPSGGKLIVCVERDNVGYDEARHRLLSPLGHRPNQTYTPCSMLICSPGEGGRDSVRCPALMMESPGGRA